VRTWIYKCNATNSSGPDTGDWRAVFAKQGAQPWGTDTLKGMNKVRRGDRVLALQSDRHELVGIALILGFVTLRTGRYVRLRPLESLHVKIPPLKKQDPTIASIPALKGGPVASVYDISDEDAERLLSAARGAKAARRLTAEEIDVDITYPEGAMTEIPVNAYERNAAARRACLRHWGTSCVVCKKDLGQVYGGRAHGLIHVHHIVPLASIRKSYRVNAIRDLRPLCPDCHAVIHRGSPMTVEELRSSFLKRRFVEGVKKRKERETRRLPVAADGASRRP
jgi:hypothetical protein